MAWIYRGDFGGLLRDFGSSGPVDAVLVVYFLALYTSNFHRF